MFLLLGLLVCCWVCWLLFAIQEVLLDDSDIADAVRRAQMSHERLQSHR